MDKQLLKALCDEGLSQSEIAKRQDVSPNTVVYWLRKYALETARARNKQKKKTWTNEQFVVAIETSRNIAQVLRKLNLVTTTGSYRTFHKYVKLLNVDTSHFDPYEYKRTSAKKHRLKSVMIENSFYSTTQLKKRLLKKNVLQNVCSICELNGEWKGKELRMILDHINGINNDHRLENLRMVCPNCNSQLPTHCGKHRFKNYSYAPKPQEIQIDKYCEICKTQLNKSQTKFCSRKCVEIGQRHVERPTKEKLQKEINSMSWCAIGRKYGVSDNAIRKWAKFYNLL